MKQVYNPYLPLYEYIPDGEPHVFDGRVYIYGSHDFAGGEKYCLGDYVTWSAPVDNLKDWRYEGVIYRKDQDPSNIDGHLELWAPDVTRGPDGKYYLYYCLSFHPEIGVAVSDSPAGPFEFLDHVKYPNSMVLNSPLPFDPAAFTDDDGRVYLYFGFSPAVDDFFKSSTDKSDESVANSNQETFKKASQYEFSKGSIVVELYPDMTTVKKSPKICVPGGMIAAGTGFEGHAFFEASSLRKIKDKYYFIYSSQNRNELCYAISDNPMEGFRYGGTIISNGDIGYKGNCIAKATTGNNHGSIIKILEDYYVFYHRQTHSTETSRQGCAEKIQILSDGSIPQVEMTSCGLNDKPLVAQGIYPAAIACNIRCDNTPYNMDYESDYKPDLPYIYEERTGEEQEHIQYISNIMDSTVIGYKYFDFNGVKTISINVRGKAIGEISVYTSDEGKAPIGVKSFCNDSNEWRYLNIEIEETNGVHPLFFYFGIIGNLEMKDICFGE